MHMRHGRVEVRQRRDYVRESRINMRYGLVYVGIVTQMLHPWPRFCVLQPRPCARL